MDDELQEKSLKLLADPRKLKEHKKHFIYPDKFKYQIENKFRCDITDRLYQQLLIIIKREIIVNSVLGFRQSNTPLSNIVDHTWTPQEGNLGKRGEPYRQKIIFLSRENFFEGVG